jgi:hypothetical protein
MKPAPVAYYQEILEKISHADERTFRKELRKAFRRLLPPEREELKQWFRSACLCRPSALQLAEVRKGDEAQLK